MKPAKNKYQKVGFFFLFLPPLFLKCKRREKSQVSISPQIYSHFPVTVDAWKIKSNATKGKSLFVSFSLLSWLTWPYWGCALSLCAAVGPGRTNKGKWALCEPMSWSGTSSVSWTSPWLSVAASGCSCSVPEYPVCLWQCLPSVWVLCGRCRQCWGWFPMGTAFLDLRGEKSWTN